MNLFIVYLFILFMPGAVMANYSSGIGALANQFVVPVITLSSFICNGSIITGTCCLLAAFIRYFRHRINPLAPPISTIIVLFVVGVLLIALPFVYLLTGTGIPFSFR